MTRCRIKILAIFAIYLSTIVFGGAPVTHVQIRVPGSLGPQKVTSEISIDKSTPRSGPAPVHFYETSTGAIIENGIRYDYALTEASE